MVGDEDGRLRKIETKLNEIHTLLYLAAAIAMACFVGWMIHQAWPGVIGP